MTKPGGALMDWRAFLGRNFRVSLACALIESAPPFEIVREVEQNEKIIDRIAATQREELEQEIAGLQEEAERVAEEARELAGEVTF